MSGGYVAAHAGLADAIQAGVDTVRVLRVPGVVGDPPLVYVQPPTLSWDGYITEPTESVYEVVLAVKADEHAVQRLFELLPLVTAAIDGARQTHNVDAVVKTAEPGVWRVGNTELPAYFIRTEVSI